DKLTVAMAAGHPPDVLWGALDPRWIATGLQLPVEDHLSARDRADFYPAALDAMRYGGTLWGFPLYQTMYCMAGNATLFQAAGIDWRGIQRDGWSWDAFLADCRALARHVEYPFVFFTRPTPELWSWFVLNNGVVDANNNGLKADGTFGWDRAAVRDALQFLRDCFSRFHIAPRQEPALTDEEQTNLFFQGRAAVSARQGPYVITEQHRIARAFAGSARLPHAGYRRFPVVLLPFPHNAGNVARAHAGGGGFMVFRQKGVDDERRVATALRLARFLTDTDAMSFAAHLSLLPSRRSGVRRFASALALDSPNMRFFQRYLASAAPRVHPPLDIAAAREARVAEVAIMPNWEAALAGAQTAAQAVAAMAQTATAVLNGT
ncbi:MAG: extracellular solute-binding protein, partial [Candidatus Eremiobacteraeota bacterium]|nr:extracellular solute-binding protein [Candidatus Eremiobacteraeota bacterium]